MAICVTDRTQCEGDFLKRIQKIATGRPDAILLREKDLRLPDILVLAHKCRDICAKEKTNLILHSDREAAEKLEIPFLHLTFPAFRRESGEKSPFIRFGVSVHTLDEAVASEKGGADWLIAGHIFATDSKKGAPPKGLDFLSDICRAVSIPVFAIGGVTPERMGEIAAVGAAGGCALSSFMTACDPAALVARFREAETGAGMGPPSFVAGKPRL